MTTAETQIIRCASRRVLIPVRPIGAASVSESVGMQRDLRYTYSLSLRTKRNAGRVLYSR